jgi:hypothetical protein
MPEIEQQRREGAKKNHFQKLCALVPLLFELK